VFCNGLIFASKLLTIFSNHPLFAEINFAKITFAEMTFAEIVKLVAEMILAEMIFAETSSRSNKFVYIAEIKSSRIHKTQTC
jgi:hypothetical protein